MDMALCWGLGQQQTVGLSMNISIKQSYVVGLLVGGHNAKFEVIAIHIVLLGLYKTQAPLENTDGGRSSSEQRRHKLDTHFRVI